MHRIHILGDARCIASSPFECPFCQNSFITSDFLRGHINTSHAQESSVSLLSEANSSTWMYVSCTACDNKFENETDMKYHLERVHEYGESCHMDPCDKCGFAAGGSIIDCIEIRPG